ncbi:transposase [Streptomyces sp. NBC_00271]|uniref:transposase n=1 Tax=Streptomyces sp. NBC_00271 TaxID=2975697 RepID=UPI003FA7A95D
MVRRREFTDAQWGKIEPLMPGGGKPGGQRADHRRVINGVLFRARSGCPGLICRSGTVSGRPSARAVAAGRRTPPGRTSFRSCRSRRCRRPGRGAARQADRQEWAVDIDSASCRAHQHPAGAPRRPPADYPQKRGGA